MDSETDATAQTIDPYPHRQLFLDDHAVEESSGVRRVLHQPERLGAILKPDVSRGQMALQSKSPPWWNPELGVWEWWYWAMYDEVPGQMYASEGRVSHYATSTDGVNWDTPLSACTSSGDRRTTTSPTTRRSGGWRCTTSSGTTRSRTRSGASRASSPRPTTCATAFQASRPTASTGLFQAEPCAQQGHVELSSRRRAGPVRRDGQARNGVGALGLAGLRATTS